MFLRLQLQFKLESFSESCVSAHHSTNNCIEEFSHLVVSCLDVATQMKMLYTFFCFQCQKCCVAWRHTWLLFKRCQTSYGVAVVTPICCSKTWTNVQLQMTENNKWIATAAFKKAVHNELVKKVHSFWTFSALDGLKATKFCFSWNGW